MTICQLRRLYPHHDLCFFDGEYEMQKTPFFHDKIARFEVINEDTIFVYMK